MKKIHLIVCLAFFYSLSIFGQNNQNQTIIIDETSEREEVALVIPIDKVWAGHPVGFALLTEGDRQYIAYYNADRHMTVGQRNLDQNEFELYTLPPKERESREGTSTILGWDSHNSVTIAVDKAGYIHLSGNMHGNGLTYFRSTKPRDITTLVQIPAMTGRDEKRCTYPRFMKTKEGALIFRYRDGGSGDGNDIYNIYSTQTQQWKRLVDTPMTDGQGLMNAYASRPQLRSDGWYHLYWVWRDTPDCSTNHDLSYMKSPDMVNWYDVYGNMVNLPATFDNKSLIVDPIPAQGGIINLAASLCFDEDQKPIFAYHKYDAAGNLQFYTARFDGKQWNIQQVTDWDYRWYFSGNGSINTEVRVGDFERRTDGYYELGYEHIKYGDGTMLLDENLNLIGEVKKPAPFRETVPLEGDFPGLLVQTTGDLGESPEPSVRYLLKWETLNRNRDRPRPQPWPEPSQLYLYQLQKPAKPWREIKTVEDLYEAYPERLKTTLEQFDLTRKGLERVRAAVELGDFPLACRELLSYYQDGGAKPFVDPVLPASSNQKDPEAEPLLRDTFTFYTQTDRVPRDANGGLNWDHQGPDNDIEWAWGLNRHPHIRTLLTAYLKTGNPDYAQRIDQDLKDWVIQSLPYPGVKSSTSMWRGLEVSFRVKAWAQVFHRLLQSEHLSPATRLLLLSSIPEHAHYLRSFHARGNNWLTMEMSGLATVAAAWPELKQSREWMDYAKAQMTESMKDQVYPDGVQVELTAHYHWVTLNNFDQFREICRIVDEPLPREYTQTLEDMWSYLAYSMRPDGNNVLNNDSDLLNYRDLVSAAAEEYKRPDWLYLATNGAQGAQPDGPPSIVYPWGGQHIMRSGYDTNAQWAFFDIGPWGFSHQHNDKLHLSVSAYGRDLLVDGGRFAYRGALADKFRSYAVNSQSHNVILIDGKGQAPGPRVTSEPITEKHYKITEEFDYSWGDFDQFKNLEGTAKHTRALLYVRDQFWIVVDKITSDRPRRIEALWHWHPDCSVEVGKKNDLFTTNEKGNLSILPLSDAGWRIGLKKGQEEPEIQGWYSKEYNKAEPNIANIYATETDGNDTFVWLLYPSEGRTPKVRAKILSQSEDGVSVRVKSPAGRWEVFVPYSDSEKANINK